MVHCRPTRSHANLTENYFFLDFRVEWIVSAVVLFASLLFKRQCFESQVDRGALPLRACDYERVERFSQGRRWGCR